MNKKISDDYISGTKMGNILYNYLRDLELNPTDIHAHHYYDRLYNHVKNTITKITTGTGHGTRHYYLEKDIMPIAKAWVDEIQPKPNVNN